MAETLPSPEDWRVSGHWLDFRGRSVFYRDAGSGEPLVCLHGFPTSSWDWYRIWGRLTGRFRVIAPDMLGFGFSDKPHPHAYSISEQADLHVALAHHLGLSSAHLLAHDYGDTVAQELLARHWAGEPESLPLDSICLLNGGLFPEAHRPLATQKLLASAAGPLAARLMGERSFRRGMRRIFGAASQPSAEELARLWELVSRDGGKHVLPELLGYIRERRDNRERWVPPLQAAAVPARFVNGPADPVSGAHMAARYHELVADADVVELPGIGHYPQLEAPERVVTALFTFHDRLADAGSAD